MRITFGHKGGWNGGQWTYNGKELQEFMDIHGCDPRVKPGMKGTVILPDTQQPIEVSTETFRVSGVDHDHGHEYSWSYLEPSFMIGSLPLPVPASVLWRQNAIIYLELE